MHSQLQVTPVEQVSRPVLPQASSPPPNPQQTPVSVLQIQRPNRLDLPLERKKETPLNPLPRLDLRQRRELNQPIDVRRIRLAVRIGIIRTPRLRQPSILRWIAGKPALVRRFADHNGSVSHPCRANQRRPLLPIRILQRGGNEPRRLGVQYNFLPIHAQREVVGRYFDRLLPRIDGNFNHQIVPRVKRPLRSRDAVDQVFGADLELRPHRVRRIIARLARVVLSAGGAYRQQRDPPTSSHVIEYNPIRMSNSVAQALACVLALISTPLSAASKAPRDVKSSIDAVIARSSQMASAFVGIRVVSLAGGSVLHAPNQYP